jgi:hypothetical protein
MSADFIRKRALRIEWAEPKRKFGTTETSRSVNQNNRILRFMHNLRSWNSVTTFLKSEKKQRHTILTKKESECDATPKRLIIKGYAPFLRYDSNLK